MDDGSCSKRQLGETEKQFYIFPFLGEPDDADYVNEGYTGSWDLYTSFHKFNLINPNP